MSLTKKILKEAAYKEFIVVKKAAAKFLESYEQALIDLDLVRSILYTMGTTAPTQEIREKSFDEREYIDGNLKFIMRNDVYKYAKNLVSNINNLTQLDTKEYKVKVTLGDYIKDYNINNESINRIARVLRTRNIKDGYFRRDGYYLMQGGGGSTTDNTNDFLSLRNFFMNEPEKAKQALAKSLKRSIGYDVGLDSYNNLTFKKI